MMVPGIEIPLETYQLVQNARPIQCFLCKGANIFRAEYCRNCSAPMALTHQALTLKKAPKTIALLGAVGAGKTVYLGMLMDILSKSDTPLQAMARGAFSISLQQAAASSLAQGRFPERTSREPEHWNWVHCTMASDKKRKPQDLIIPDIAGGAIASEIDHPGTFPAVRALLTSCSGILLLVDAALLQSGDRSQNYELLKMLTFVDELKQQDKTKRWRKKKLPIAIVFTKADACDAAQNDPTAFAKTSAASLIHHCQEHLPFYKTFSCGVAGDCAYREVLGGGRQHIPLRIEPHGIVEPMRWVFEHMSKR